MVIGTRFAKVLADAQAASGSKSGESAFADIYRDLAPVVAGYVRGKGGQEPDDIVSETFVSVARNIGRFTGDEDAFRSWVFTIAHRRLVDERRKRGRRRDDPHDPATMPTTTTASSEATALEGLSHEAVEELLADLTPDQRSVVLLRIVGGLSVREVATVLGKQESAVKVLQHRAINALARTHAVTDSVG